MPIYDYKCNQCDKIFEVVCRISEIDNQHCPHCNSIEVARHHATAIPIGDPVRLGVTGIPGGFKEVLSKIHSNNYKSNLADKLSRN